MREMLYERILLNMENQVRRLEEQIHFLVEILTEQQLEDFIEFSKNLQKQDKHGVQITCCDDL